MRAIRDRIDAVLAAGLANAGKEFDDLSRELGVRDLDSIAQAVKGIERIRLWDYRPLRVAGETPAALRVENPGSGDRYVWALGILESCAYQPFEELRRTRDRLWSEAEAAPFVVAGLRNRSEVALPLAEAATSNPIVGRTAVRLAVAWNARDLLKRLMTRALPIARWAEDAWMEPSPAREVYLRNREAKLRDDRVRTAREGRGDARARAVAELGETRDPVFAPVLADAYEEPKLRSLAAVALARVGEDRFLEEWIREGHLRALGLLRERRGLAAVAQAAARGAAGAIAALREAGEDGREAVLDLKPPSERLLSLWKEREA